MKPGWRTTEFWLAALGNAAMVTGAIAKVFPMPVALGIAGVTTVAYGIARTVLKRNEMANDRSNAIAGAINNASQALGGVLGGGLPKGGPHLHDLGGGDSRV